MRRNHVVLSLLHASKLRPVECRARRVPVPAPVPCRAEHAHGGSFRGSAWRPARLKTSSIALRIDARGRTIFAPRVVVAHPRASLYRYCVPTTSKKDFTCFLIAAWIQRAFCPPASHKTLKTSTCRHTHPHHPEIFLRRIFPNTPNPQPSTLSIRSHGVTNANPGEHPVDAPLHLQHMPGRIPLERAAAGAHAN